MVAMAPTAQSRPHYDGLADWYDAYNADAARSNHADLADLLAGTGEATGTGETGEAAGTCLDLGCGTGQNLPAVRAPGRTVIGLDFSADQLRHARRRTVPGEALVRADAARLPFADAAFDSVISVWLSTDVDDFAAVLAEVGRVLKPGGTFVYFGAHPCFCGPHTEARADGARVVHPGYRRAGRHRSAPWWGEDGVRSRLGVSHLPLADLLNGFAAAGLAITRAVEPSAEPIPWKLALAATKHGGTA